MAPEIPQFFNTSTIFEKLLPNVKNAAISQEQIINRGVWFCQLSLYYDFTSDLR